MNTEKETQRRFLMKVSAAVLASGCLSIPNVFAAIPRLNTKVIPSSKEQIPVIGMGSWMTFNIGQDQVAFENCVQVLKAFFDAGGSVIDTSPMYGSSEQVIGQCLKRLGRSQDNFSATKVWTPFKSKGVEQMQHAYQLWGSEQIDLYQIHNLVSWQDHLETLQALKSQQKIRYIGLTTSHGRRHDECEKIMKTHAIDFIQVTYNVLNREIETRILPLAQELGIAVMVNRPFQRNGLFRRFSSKPLPMWVSDIDCASWAQYFLKFIVSHPAVTCAIPATSQVAHMKENMAVLTGRLPDENMRQKMLDYLKVV